MELTIFLSKVFGLYLLIAGLVIMSRQSYFASVVSRFVEERLTRMILAILELVAGIFLVMGHDDWVTTPGIIITIFGWMLVAEGVLYLALPDKKLAKFIKMFNKPMWYRWGGALSLLLGAYLLSFGYGWLL